jgi:hypothetical protein
MDGIKGQAAEATSQVQNTKVQLLTLYSHFSTISNVIAQQISRSSQDQATQAAAQTFLQASQIVTTELSIAQTVAMAITYGPTNPVLASFLMAQAIAMQDNLIKQQLQLEKTRRAQARIEAYEQGFNSL